MKFAKTLQMAANSLPEEYKGQVLNYKKFKKSINKIVNNLESTGVYEIPENEKCKVIYSLSNKDGNEGEIKSSLILYIDKDYVAELSQKDALELNSEEITIDPKLKEVIELSDDTSIEQEKVTKEKIIKSFQLSDNGKNEYIFNKKLPLKRLNRRNNSDDGQEEPVSAFEGGRRKTLFNESISAPNGASKLKRSKSDGDKMEKIAKGKASIMEVKKNETNSNAFQHDAQLCSEPESAESPISSPVLKNIVSSAAKPIPAASSSSYPTPSPSPSSSTNGDNIPVDISNTDGNNDVKDNIPELEKSNDVINDKNTDIKGKEEAIEEDEMDEMDEMDEKVEIKNEEKDVEDNEKITNEEKEVNEGEEEVDDVIDCTTEANNNLSDEAAKDNTMKSLKVLLEADAQFLNELAASLTQLSAFQDEYKKVFETKISIMANILSEVSSPNMKDTYRWRELLGIYCDSNIWKYRGKDRTPDEVIEQLKLFEVKANTIRKKFKTRKSQNLLKEFIQLNYDIVSIKRFYELNQTAVYKILKKHDKRTHLLASEGFPQFARDETFFKDNIVRSLIFQISSRLLNVIPNPAEYLCPICQEISYKPIRLDCGHLFCLRCLLKAKRTNCRDCPLCRQKDVVFNANSSHLDSQLMIQLKRDFPREVKAKMRDNKTEKAKEDSEALLHMYGYGNPNLCIVM